MKFVDSLGFFFLFLFTSLYCCAKRKIKYEEEEDFERIEISMKEDVLFCCGTPQSSPRIRSNSRFFHGIDDIY